MACAGVLLTGGRSRRLGRDKATLVIGGETLAQRAARVLSTVCDPVVEAGPGVSGLRAVRDDPPGAGPLAGVFAAIGEFDLAGPVLVLACDMPFVDEPLLELIAQWPGANSVVPTVGGHAQYTCARWSTAALQRVRRSADVSMRTLVDDDTEFVDEHIWGRVASAQAFRDVDTPDDLDSLGL